MLTYRPVIAPSVAGRLRHLPPEVKRGVKEAIRAISADPGRGEPLERELRGYRKYRVRRFRVVYRVDRAARTVDILAIGHRRTIYEEAAEKVRAGSEVAATSRAVSPPAAQRSSRRRAVRHR